MKYKVMAQMQIDVELELEADDPCDLQDATIEACRDLCFSDKRSPHYVHPEGTSLIVETFEFDAM